MNNRTFQVQANRAKHRKLDVTLRQFTEDRLTCEQRRKIRCGLGDRFQYTVQVCQDPGAFCRVANPKNARDGQTVIRTLFGDLECLSKSVAVLVQRIAPGERSSTVYIYLPIKKEETHDVPRKKEAVEP